MFTTTYIHTSRRLIAIKQLGVYHTRWNNIHHDIVANRQKLYCQLPDGTKCVLSVEYDESTALINVYPEAPINTIGDTPALELVPKVLAAIQSEYPEASVVGENQYIRVII